MPTLEPWMDDNQPDVICLQETKVGDRAFPRTPFLERGYELAVAGSGGHGGVALLSRFGLSAVTLGIPGAKRPLAERRSISADVPTSASSDAPVVRLHTVYAPNGRKVGTRHHEVKLAWLALFLAWVTMDGLADGRPTMVAGDLNVAPTDLDVWEPARYRRRNLTSPPERNAFDAFVEAGLVDVVRSHHGDDAVFTWWNRRGDFYQSDRGWRLDHVLADPATAATVSSVTIDRVERGRAGSSDHAPLVVDLAG